MKLILSILICLLTFIAPAQELFTWSEPASNMAAKAIGFRETNTLMNEQSPAKDRYQLLPEIMWGVSGKIMVHAEGFLSNTHQRFSLNGAALYFKYRFFSQDEVHSHFRLAAYARGALNKNPIQQRAIDLNGYNSGYEYGLIATKLINKIAYSAGTGFLHAMDNGGKHIFYYGNNNRNALAYNLSVGKLLLPKEYTSYKQTNMNGMLELLGQTNLGSGKTYVDLAPTIQFIILSKMRLDAGYRFAVVKDLSRTALQGFLLRLEYNIVNVY